MTTAFSPPNPTPSERDAEFMRHYTHLLALQTEYKHHLAHLYRENRRLRALYTNMPESSIPIDVLDVRANKNAPRMQDLVSPGDEEEGEDGRGVDYEILNARRILGSIDIDVNSMDDEIKKLEYDNRRVGEWLRRKGIGQGRGGVGGNVVDLEGEEEIMESVEEREEEIPLMRMRSRKYVEVEKVSDQGVESSEKEGKGVALDGEDRASH
ncbi:MAG: hypothetical protein LQ338_003165 [Usnochroma carphineum]|nr:MAG: hypothetical protein LQ338_003165 [Usnochroma carphineum]